MIESIKFGEVFRYKEEEFVFLAKSEEIVYVAQILNREETRKINDLYKRLSRGSNSSECQSRPLFCYVILRTEEFKDRMAHFKNTQQDESDFLFDKIGCRLNQADLQDIKNEILDPKSPVPLELKELVGGLDI